MAVSHVVVLASGHGYVDDTAIHLPDSLESTVVIAKSGSAAGIVIAHSDGDEAGMADSAIYWEHALDPCIDTKVMASSSRVSSPTSVVPMVAISVVGGNLSNSKRRKCYRQSVRVR